MPRYADAFLAQAASDLDAYEALSRSTLPSCHRLHYLQMWLEKLCKAYVSLSAASDELAFKHQVVHKVLPKLIAEHWRRAGLTTKPDVDAVRRLCRAVDLLHPQVDGGGLHPDNVEYPWPNGAHDYSVPAQFKFSLARELETRAGRDLLKAATMLTRTPLPPAP